MIVLLTFPLPIILVIISFHKTMNYDQGWLYVISILVVIYFTYLTIKYIKGIIVGFK